MLLESFGCINSQNKKSISLLWKSNITFLRILIHLFYIYYHPLLFIISLPFLLILIHLFYICYHSFLFIIKLFVRGRQFLPNILIIFYVFKNKFYLQCFVFNQTSYLYSYLKKKLKTIKRYSNTPYSLFLKIKQQFCNYYFFFLKNKKLF